MRIKIIACEVMKEEIMAVKPVHNVDYRFVSMELHTRPEKLHEELVNLLDTALGYDRVILGFGLCGGALHGLKVKNGILTIPKIHDCIPLFLGSRKTFDRLQEKRGTFYLTCGWMESEKSVITEYHRVCDKYGETKARKVFNMMYDSYENILFIHTNHPRNAEGMEKSKEVSRLLDLSFDTQKGDMGYFQKLVNGPWNEDEFINITPGEFIRESDF